MAKINIVVPLLTLILSVIVIEFLNTTTKPKHPYAGLNIVQIVENYGYTIETHEVTTDDGYILTLHRIPGREKSIPVLFMHGFSQSAIDFVNLGPGKSLSFLLADRGFDIWLGNARGTAWSRKHKVLDPDRDMKFWDYSLQEIGVYDAPAFIDYILDVTNQETLHYIGYSQGTSVFFILGSEKPEYVTKVRLMTALAPAIFLKDPIGPACEFLVNFSRVVEGFFQVFRIHEFLARNSLIAHYMSHICNENSLFVGLCLHHTFLLHGYNHDEVNRTMLSLIFSNSPDGVSPKQVLHIIQFMRTGNFHKYDLGLDGNLKNYRQEEAPLYDLSKVTTPVALYYSSNDWTVNFKNMERIVQTLPNVVKSYHVPLESFNHNDFLYAINVVDLLYNAVIDEILKY